MVDNQIKLGIQTRKSSYKDFVLLIKFRTNKSKDLRIENEKLKSKLLDIKEVFYRLLKLN